MKPHWLAKSCHPERSEGPIATRMQDPSLRSGRHKPFRMT